MDFTNIFDTYTNNDDTNKRSNIIASTENLTGQVSYDIQNFITSLNESENAIDKNIENKNADDSPSQNDINPSVLEALSELDNLDSSSNNNIAENNIEPESNMNDPLQNNTDQLDLDDFINTLDTNNISENSNVDHNDLDHIILNDESVDHPSIHSEDNEFSIENPEELPKQKETILETTDENTDKDIIVPESSETNLEDSDILTPENIENLSPADYENIDNDIKDDFDAWKKEEPEEIDISKFALSEEQIFSIREKINTFKNKNLRFMIRNIMIEPASYAEIFEQLVSLILFNSSEEILSNFIKKHLNIDILKEKVPEISPIDDNNTVFFADDVVVYQENLYKIQTELLKIGKSFSFYGIIVILSSLILWTGVIQPIQINSLFKKGLAAIRDNKTNKGESYFQQATKIAGKPVPKWNIRYADIYKEKKMIGLAEKKYLQVLDYDPSEIEVSKEASDFYMSLGKENYRKALQVMKIVSKYHPKKFDVWDHWGSIYITMSENINNDIPKQTDLLYKAINVYLQFIKNNPKNIAPYYKMIDIYIKIGNAEQIQKITELIENFNPKYPNIDVLNKLATYHTDHRNLDDSDKIFQKMIPLLDNYSTNIPGLQKIMHKEFNINPKKINNILGKSYYEYARYKMLFSDNSSAAHLLTNSMHFDSQNPKTYNLLGEVFLSSPEIPQRLSKAKKLFEQALAIDPKEFKPHINIGHIYYYWDSEIENIEQAHNIALYHYKLAQGLVPKNYKNYLLNYNTGWLEYKNQNITDAIDQWSSIYKENPTDPLLSYSLGSALYKKGNPQLAQVEFNKSIASLEMLRKKIPVPNINNKRHREIYIQLIKVYNNLGVINANYALANPSKRTYFETQALLNFYTAKDIADQLNKIYNIAEYNLGVITRPNIVNRKTEFDNDIPKQTTLENTQTDFNNFLIKQI